MKPVRSRHAPQLGPYRVEGRFGRGGMSRTFRCTRADAGDDAPFVLVKTLEPERADDDSFLEMFLDEAKLSMRLQHRNIARVFEVGEQDGVPWLAMEYVAGPNLAMVSRRLQGAPTRPYGHIARLLADAARGLAHAHGLRDGVGAPLGIIHRDVSLGNVVVAPDGTAKLIDFGIAWWEHKANQTADGLLKGKLHYMAPEQLRNAVDHRVDVYQAGVCLYWLTLGRPPVHHPDPVELWRKRLSGDFPAPTSLRDDYPPALEAIVLRALALDPDERYPDADEFADALVAFCTQPGPWRSTREELGAWVRGLFSSAELGDFEAGAYELRATDVMLPSTAVLEQLEDLDSAAFVNLVDDAAVAAAVERIGAGATGGSGAAATPASPTVPAADRGPSQRRGSGRAPRHAPTPPPAPWGLRRLLDAVMGR